VKGINVGVPSQRGSGLCAGATCRLATRMMSAELNSVRYVVFPLADYVLGTSVRANEGDLKYMEQWDYDLNTRLK